EWYERLDRQPGLLYLPHAYVVPGGHFNEMYGWDSYFMARGAIADGRSDLARAMLENFVYQIEHYGKIGNSNRSYHRGRSQPPFLGALARSVSEAMPPGPERDAVIRRALQAGERELREIWLSPPRITPTGLSLYRDEWNGPLPETSGQHYKVWRGDDPEFRAHQRAVRESGWDMTLRFGERGHRTIPVCLNALLYGYERDLAELYRQLDGAGSPDASRLDAAAEARRKKMNELMWDEARGLFFDWDVDRSARNDYEHVASYYALFVGLASEAQARRIVERLPAFEMAGGLAVSSERSRHGAAGEQLQWDWPYGWAPHQILAVEGLRRYGFGREADRVSIAWLSMLFDIAGANNGLVKEKYDVVNRSADVPVEYGNQGGDRGPFAHYPAGCAPEQACAPELTLVDLSSRAIGFGWTNASVSLLLDGLSEAARQRLEQ
ncbi:MAG TPA: trehalase family glycosidase, partial [Myxococcaceae bacterium]|nr:trehalase family glycosidase [Myxococcaceae bacterium]